VTPAVLLTLFVAEFLYFDLETSRHVTWIYPRWNDQIQYLTESYAGYTYSLAHGFWPGVLQTLVNPSAQGTLHDFYALLVFRLAGPSRSAALSLNILALIAWQAALFIVVRRTKGARLLAWAAVMLPVCLRWPWNGWTGSMADFRLDHLGMCALGTTLALGLLTDSFRSSRWSAVFGAAVGWTLLTRFIMGPYFVLIFIALLVWAISGPGRLRQSGNLLLAALIAAAVAGPVFWINRESVWNYYWIGHFTGPESAIRNPHMGLAKSVEFVSGKLLYDHLGAFFGWVAGATTVLLAWGAWRHPKPTKERAPARMDWWLFGSVFLLAPALVLTLHRQKSEITVGALVPGAIVVVLALWFELQRRNARRWPDRVAVSGVFLAAGVFFVLRQSHPTYDAAYATDARKVNMLADYIYEHAKAAGLATPGVAVDQVTDCLDGQVLRVMVYERHHVWIPYMMKLPTGIAADQEPVLMQRLAESDFVFLTEDGPMVWPYDRQMRAMLPQTQAWCKARLRMIERFTIFGRRMVLYQRPEIP
jgi:hypothetical protein